MQGSAINRSGNHGSQRSRVIVIVALFRDLLLDEIRSQRTGRLGAGVGYIIVCSRGHGHSRDLGMKESRQLFPCVSPQFHG